MSADQSTSSPALKEWPLWEVFVRSRAGLDHKTRPQLVPQLWNAHATTLDVIEVPFLHPQLTSPAAVALIATFGSRASASSAPVVVRADDVYVQGTTTVTTAHFQNVFTVQIDL